MKNYYDILDVERTADAPEIKRAYYKLVKKYPPQQFPEEFKELRAAYEVLSDETKRADYDKDEDMPEAAALLYRQYKTLAQKNLHKQARETIEELLKRYPDLPGMKAELARSLAGEGKSGKASEVWEELCGLFPDNAEYIFELARAYEERGWRKKAVTEYTRAIGVDPGNVGAWESLVRCHLRALERAEMRRTCLMGIDALKEKGKESIRLYIYAITDAVNENDDCEAYFNSATRLMAENPEELIEQGEEIVSLLLNCIMTKKRAELLPHIQKMAGLFPEISDDLRDDLDSAAFYRDLEEFSNKGYSDVLHDIFLIVFQKDDEMDEEEAEEDRRSMLAMEYEVLTNLSSYRSELLRIQSEYPQLYALHADFFNEALRTRDKEKLIHQRVNMLRHIDYSSDYNAPQQFRRDEPKVGRNDPCPCGSGKKYKKCCGA